MTIPRNNWCATCQEGVHDHVTICTVCGDTLGPAPTTNSFSSTVTTTTSPPRVRILPESIVEDFRRRSQNPTGQDIRALLSTVREQVEDIHALAREAVEGVNGAAIGAAAAGGGGWQQIPAQLLEPQNTEHRGRPTSKQVLAKIPRIVLSDKSSLFRQGTFSICTQPQQQQQQLQEASTTNTVLNFPAIPGEFGISQQESPSIVVDNATLIVGYPKTVKGGLSEQTKSQIRQTPPPTIVYLERGDGITFVTKAMEAQNVGATAVIIGNNMPSPWPYIMKDSTGEADQFGLSIPVAMIKQEDSKQVLEYCEKQKSPQNSSSSIQNAPLSSQRTITNCCLKIQSLSKDCAVCCETFVVKNTVMQLPVCGHIFHEQCATLWLTKHNTCPFCRMELPTDDREYEQERRRLQRTHAGSDATIGHSQWNEYYR